MFTGIAICCRMFVSLYVQVRLFSTQCFCLYQWSLVSKKNFWKTHKNEENKSKLSCAGIHLRAQKFVIVQPCSEHIFFYDDMKKESKTPPDLLALNIRIPRETYTAEGTESA